MELYEIQQCYNGNKMKRQLKKESFQRDHRHLLFEILRHNKQGRGNITIQVASIYYFFLKGKEITSSLTSMSWQFQQRGCCLEENGILTAIFCNNGCKSATKPLNIKTELNGMTFTNTDVLRKEPPKKVTHEGNF